MYSERIKEISLKYYDRVVELRHTIHMHPELAFEEYKTAKLVADELKKMNIEVQEGIAGTGVVGLIKGAKEGKTILLRADMDALAVVEDSDLPFKSQVEGKMHACGHDGHVAGLLGAAMILNEMKEELSGNVKLVFQPAEESTGGAQPMIDEGILENPKVDAAVGLHLWGEFKEGEVHLKEGPVMASPDVFRIKVIGKGGHAAMPHLSIDPVVMAAEVITSIQAIVSRRVPPLKPAVISCCYLHGGDTYNVIPNVVEIRGTVRAFDEELRDSIPAAIENILRTTTESYGGSYEFEFDKRFPPLINNEDMVQIAKKSISGLIGEENVYKQKEPNMGGEDFAYFAKAVPSAFYFVGITPEGEDPIIHHHPKFGFDDKNLLLASQSLAKVAVDYLNLDV